MASITQKGDANSRASIRMLLGSQKGNATNCSQPAMLPGLTHMSTHTSHFITITGRPAPTGLYKSVPAELKPPNLHRTGCPSYDATQATTRAKRVVSATLCTHHTTLQTLQSEAGAADLLLPVAVGRSNSFSTQCLQARILCYNVQHTSGGACPTRSTPRLERYICSAACPGLLDA